jgi:lysophospholipase L1-like esterase
MRDDEPRLAPDDASACNIVVLGDSFTFGFFVDGDKTYPSVLERLLAGQVEGKTVQVLNFGVGGYSTPDEALTLEHKGLAWDPALIVIGYTLNDADPEPMQHLHMHYQQPRWWQHVNILRAFAGATDQWKTQRLGGGDFLRRIHATDGDKWHSVTEAFDRIASLAREAATPVLLAVFPMMRVNDWANYPYADLHDQVAREGRENGFTVVDLLPHYAKHPPASMVAAPGDSHPTVLAHQVVAQAILEAIQSKGLLPGL